MVEYLIVNLIQLWLTVSLACGSTAILLVMRGHQCLEFKKTPMEEFRFLFSLLRKTWVPGVNVIYGISWLYALLFKRDEQQLLNSIWLKG